STEPDDTELAFPRVALAVLMDVDGRSTVRDIAARRGLIRALKGLGALCELGLVEFDVGPAPTPSPPDTSDGHEVRPNPSGLGEALERVRRGVANRRGVRIATELAQAAIFAGALVFAVRTVVQNFRVEG